MAADVMIWERIKRLLQVVAISCAVFGISPPTFSGIIGKDDRVPMNFDLPEDIARNGVGVIQGPVECLNNDDKPIGKDCGGTAHVTENRKFLLSVAHLFYWYGKPRADIADYRFYILVKGEYEIYRVKRIKSETKDPTRSGVGHDGRDIVYIELEQPVDKSIRPAYFPRGMDLRKPIEEFNADSPNISAYQKDKENHPYKLSVPILFERIPQGHHLQMPNLVAHISDTARKSSGSLITRLALRDNELVAEVLAVNFGEAYYRNSKIVARNLAIDARAYRDNFFRFMNGE